MPAMTFTMDVEDPRPNNQLEKRYPVVTHEVLDFLQQQGIRGTFFCVGDIANDCPNLIKKISDEGHEVALHSLSHTPLELQNPAIFKQETEYAKKLLEDISQQNIVGYRAPIFSLTKKSRWAVDILTELGFSYSSSVLPTVNPLYCYPEAPDYPYKWPSGLIELPAPVADFAGIKMPYLGGIYLRYLPFLVIQSLLLKSNDRQGLWCYCHPYDFDHQQSYYTMKNTSILVSILLWINRKGSYKKIKQLFNGIEGVSISKPFREQLANNQFANLPLFDSD